MTKPSNAERGVEGKLDDRCKIIIYGISPKEIDHVKQIMKKAGTSLSEELIRTVNYWLGLESQLDIVYKINQKRKDEIKKLYSERITNRIEENKKQEDEERLSKEKELDILKNKLTPVISSMIGTVCRFGKKSIEYQQVLGEVRYYAEHNSLRTPTDAEMESIVDELLLKMNHNYSETPILNNS